MKITNTLPYAQGYNLVHKETEEGGLQFGILKISQDREYCSAENCYRSYLLLKGKAAFIVGGKKRVMEAGKRYLITVVPYEKTEIFSLSDESQVAMISQTDRGQGDGAPVRLREFSVDAGKWCHLREKDSERKALVMAGFYPENGFGILQMGKEAYLLQKDTCVVIRNSCEANFVCAPAYKGNILLVEWK